MKDDSVFTDGVALLQGALQLDHSTSMVELGSIFEWQADKPLQRLKRDLADAYGVFWSYPSTCGTTALNVLALLTACPMGGKVLVNRDAHTSVSAAIIHGDLRPTYLVPNYDAQLGISLGPTLASFKEALSKGSVDCVFLTSPNYFGVVGEMAEIISFAHERGLPVVVDAAHAPHFHFCEKLPDAAEDLGADLVTQSTHKVASALSQGSLLLIRKEEFIAPLYEHVNDLGFVSTSFSYPILASLELGVRQLVEEGEVIWTQTIRQAMRFRQAVHGIPGVSCFGHEQQRKPGFRDFDCTRITLDVSGTGRSGFQFQQQLIEEWIYPEMATLKHVVFLFTPGTSESDVHKLLSAVRRIAERAASKRNNLSTPPPPTLPKVAATPRMAKFARKKSVSLKEAMGEVSGETIATYPPGTPIVVAGEIVSAEVIDYLRFMKDRGAVLKGASDPHFQTLQILSS